MSGKNNKSKKERSEGLAVREAELPAARDEFAFFGNTPFTLMRRFMTDMDRLFQEFNGLRSPAFDTRLENNAWTPKVEISRNDGEMIVRADLPGMNREDINVEIGEDVLTLTGERKQEIKEEKEGFYRSEVNFGSFYRSIPLPEAVKPEDATARFENGVLEVKIALPKVESNTRKIEITSGSPEQPKAISAAK